MFIVKIIKCIGFKMIKRLGKCLGFKMIKRLELK